MYSTIICVIIYSLIYLVFIQTCMTDLTCNTKTDVCTFTV